MRESRGSSNTNKHYSRREDATSPYKLVLVVGTFCLASMSLLPILMLETTMSGGDPSSWSSSTQIAVHHLMYRAWQFTHPDDHPTSSSSSSTTRGSVAKDLTSAAAKIPVDKVNDPVHISSNKNSNSNHSPTRQTKDGRSLPDIQVTDLTPDTGFTSKALARGVAGRSLEETPAIVGSSRPHIDCDVNVDSLAYWNDATNSRDDTFVSPFQASPPTRLTQKYISFSTDRGGWNNVRMSLEILFVLAAATGRTLVLPPKEPLYLMHHDKANRYRGFADFFPIHTPQFQKRVKVITFQEFLELEKDNLSVTPNDKVWAAADHCDKRDKSSNACKSVFEYLASVADKSPEISASHSCVVFDKAVYQSGAQQQLDPATQEYLEEHCGKDRSLLYWTQQEYDTNMDLVHFRAAEKQYRLLTHFYGMLYFTEPAVDHYYKRFVRDFLHYHDAIYCAAGKIVKAVQYEGAQRGLAVDDSGAGGFSALHVRRGDLQYKKVKIPAQEWYDNTKEVWRPNEILYIATDERDKSFFDDLAAHYDLRFLDDYWDFANLGELDPNYMGMIDTIVASRGRAFAGTWFSTFSGYINRLRGYHGLSMMDSWYSFLPKKEAVHSWKVVDHFAYAFEWPDGWVGIDADVWPSKDKF